MPEWSPPRRFTRHPFSLPLLHRTKGVTPARAGVGWTRNLSEGGACVELPDDLKISTRVQILLQTDHGSIEVEAEVVWAGESSAMSGGVLYGLAFTRIAPGQRPVLAALLRSSPAERRHAGVRLPARFSVLWRVKGEAGPARQGYVGDISRAGLSLRLPQALSPGTEVVVALQISDEPVTAEGTIVWVEPPPRRRSGEPIRHGLRFTALEWTQALALALFLAALP